MWRESTAKLGSPPNSAFVARDNGPRVAYYRRALSSRRRSSLTHAHDRAHEAHTYPKTLELETRLARLELCCGEFDEALALVKKRLQSLQAQLDYLAARI